MSDNVVKIMVVDDQQSIREAIGYILTENDFSTCLIEDGKQCLEMVEQEHPDLILLDVQMPDMDGYEVCQHLREHQQTALVPIIFISAKVEHKDRIRAFELGADDYLTKPVETDHLIQRINLHIRRRLKNRMLEQQAKESMKMAMEAMTFSGELGLLLQLMKESAEIIDHKILIEKVDEVGQHFGLNCCYMITEQDSTPLFFQCEENSVSAQVLLKSIGTEKIFNFGCRTIFSESTISILVKNMPINDMETYGRLKDHLAILCSIADQHIRTLNITKHLEKQRHHMLSQLIDMCEGNIKTIHDKAMTHNHKINTIMENLICQLEEKLMFLGLEDDQEAALIRIASDASNELENAENISDELESGLMSVIAGLNTFYDREFSRQRPQ